MPRHRSQFVSRKLKENTSENNRRNPWRKRVPVEPFAITKGVAKVLFGTGDLVERLIHHSRPEVPEAERWIAVIDRGGRGRDMLIDYQSLKLAYHRIRSGEFPPKIPSGPTPPNGRNQT
jgi:hypothetical protein